MKRRRPSQALRILFGLFQYALCQGALTTGAAEPTGLQIDALNLHSPRDTQWVPQNIIILTQEHITGFRFIPVEEEELDIICRKAFGGGN
jgi:hypothetical protein